MAYFNIVVGSFIPRMSIFITFFISHCLCPIGQKVSFIFVIRSVVDDFESVIAKCNGKFFPNRKIQYIL